MADGRSDLRDNSVAIGTEGVTVKQASMAVSALVRAWRDARLAMCRTKINTPECTAALRALGEAEDALCTFAGDVCVSHWQPIETAPNNLRILVEKSRDANGPDEIAMAWLDRGDGKFWYSPQGGMLSWVPQRWRHLPE